MSVKLILLLMTFLWFLSGALLLWRGISLTNNKVWKEHAEWCVAQGLHPKRTAYWERSARWGRVTCLFVSMCFLCMGGRLLHMILSAPFGWWVWW